MLRMLIPLSIILILSSPLCHSAQPKFYWLIPTHECLEFDVLFNEIFMNFGMIEKRFYSINENELMFIPHIDEMPIWLDNLTDTERQGEFKQTEEFKYSLGNFTRYVDQYLMPNFNGSFVIQSDYCSVHLRGALHNASTIDSAEEEKIKVNENKIKYIQQLMEMALTLIKNKAPNGHYGYENCPSCRNTSDGDDKTSCYDGYQADNDRMSWLWQKQDIIFVAIEARPKLSITENLEFLIKQMDEAMQIVDRHNKAAKIVPYVQIVDQAGNQLKEALLSTVFQHFVDRKFSEVILLSHSNLVNSMTNCLKLHDYLNQHIGPAIVNAYAYAAKLHYHHIRKLNSSTANEGTSDESMPEKDLDVTKKHTNSHSESQPFNVWIFCFCVLLTQILSVESSGLDFQ